VKKMILKTLAGVAVLAAASNAMAVETLIESFENDPTDTANWQQVSSPNQTVNFTNNNAATPTFVTSHVTHGSKAGQFPLGWVIPGAAATGNLFVPGALPLLHWGARNNLAAPAALPNGATFPVAGSILKADVFNNSTTDTYQFALIVIDGATLKRGPFVSLPPNAATAYAWDLPNQAPTIIYSAAAAVSTFANANVTLRGFAIYTETVPVSTSSIDLDNIRVDTPQSDLTAPPVPQIVSIKQGAAIGDLVVTWDAVSAPDLASYKVYLATDADFTGNRFNFSATPAATVTAPATTTTLTGVAVDTNVYIKITAMDNAAPTPNESNSDITLCARLASDGSAPVDTVVLDYDRHTYADTEFLQNGYFHGSAYWAQSLGAQTTPRTFQSCRPSAIGGSVTLNPSAGIVYWTTNRDGETVIDQTLSAASVTALTTYVNAGGDLLLTGTSLGEDLTAPNGDVADNAFYADVLKATLTAADNAGTAIDADANFPSVANLAVGTDVFNVGAGSSINNEQVGAGAGGTGVFGYAGAQSAGVISANDVIYLGFPFEAIRDSSNAANFVAARTLRTAFLADSITYLEFDAAVADWTVLD